MHDIQRIKQAVEKIQSGGVIAYPTEAVYGLGCDPFNEEAVLKLLALKNRSMDKGLILVASQIKQIENLIEPIEPFLFERVKMTWPGPYTWVFPATQAVPKWIRGKHTTVAVRVSQHPVIQLLCERLKGPIVSTSANHEGEAPARDFRTVSIKFDNALDCVVSGSVSGASKPTPIRDAVTHLLLRR